ncbi:MAG: hypothetical protein R3261_10070 [Alphaproteobacteria bacterium]|nr:hypothetical protein [Alphaproteobacteria bacterium]
MLAKDVTMGALFTFASLSITACSNIYEPRVTGASLEPGAVLSSTASLSHLVVQDRESSLVTCSHPQPDAAFEQSESGSFSIALVSTGNDEKGGEEENSGEAEMAGRTPAVLISRELFFRACEFSQNYKLNKDEAIALYNKTLESVTQVWATEASNTTVNIGDTISNTNGFSVTSSSVSSDNEETDASSTSGSESSDSSSDDTF